MTADVKPLVPEIERARRERRERRALGLPARNCEACGWTPPPFTGSDGILQEHHVIPRARGGSTNPWNLVRLCPNHHVMAHVALYAGALGGHPYLPRSAAHLIAAVRMIDALPRD